MRPNKQPAVAPARRIKTLVCLAVVLLVSLLATSTIALGAGATVSGTVTTRAGGAPLRAKVTLYRLTDSANPALVSSWVNVGSWYSSSTDGSFSITGRTAGTYRVLFEASGWWDQWYNGRDNTTVLGAADVVVAADAVVTGIDAQLSTTRLSGIVTSRASGSPLYANVRAYRLRDGADPALVASWQHIISVTSSAIDGSYSLAALPTGTYRVLFEKSGYFKQYHRAKPLAELANPVSLAQDDAINGIDAALVLSSADSAAPTTAPGYSILGDGTVRVTLSASDNTGGSGVACTLYSIDGGAPQDYVAPFVVTAPGNRRLAAWSYDLAGNREATDTTLSFTVAGLINDVTAPISTAAVTPPPSGSAWWRENVRLTLSGTDEPGGSGWVTVRYRTDTGPFLAAPSNPFTLPTFTSDGDTRVEYYSVDASGNVESPVQTARVRIDRTPPVVTVVPSGTDASASRQVSIVASDALSSIGLLQYRVDGQTTKTALGASVVTPPVTKFGPHTVRFFAKDGAGNSRSGSVDFTVGDQGAPTTAISFAPAQPASGWWRGDVQTTVKAIDSGGSGIDRIGYVITPPGGVAQSGSTPANPWSPAVFAAEGITTLDYWAVDRAGNEQSPHARAYIKIDRTAPSRPSMPRASSIAETSVRLDWPAVVDPAGSGRSGYRVYRNGARIADVTANTITVRKGLTAGGTYGFTVATLDRAGNVSAASDTLFVTMRRPGTAGDRTPPTVGATVVPSGWTNADSVSVSIYAADGSGYVSLTRSGAAAVSGPSPQTAVVTVSAEGRTTVAFSATDQAGLRTSGSALVRIDRTPPSAPQAPAWTAVDSSTVYLGWPASTDAASGVSGYDVFDGLEQIGSVTGTSFAVTGLTPGSTHSFSLAARDAAGNYSAASAPLGLTVPTDDVSSFVIAGIGVVRQLDVPAEGRALPLGLTFSSVRVPGEVRAAVVGDPPHRDDSSFRSIGDYWSLSFSGALAGPVEVTLPYDPGLPDERARRLVIKQWRGNEWRSVDLRSVDTTAHTVTGQLPSLGPVVLAESTSTDRSTSIRFVSKSPPSSYRGAARFVVHLTDTAGRPLAGRTVVLEKSGDGRLWNAAGVMSPVSGVDGEYAAAVTDYAASGRTYLRARFAGETAYDSARSASWSFLPRARLTISPRVRRRTVDFTGSLAPKHAGTASVTVKAQLLASGRVVRTKTLIVRVGAGKTSFKGRFALSRGTWRITASHSDASHGPSSAAKTVRVR